MIARMNSMNKPASVPGRRAGRCFGFFRVMSCARAAVLALACFIACPIPGAPTSHAAKSARLPNFVFILTDDQRFDSMGCAGNRLIRTPNIDRLAASGARFRNHFVTTSICCVSRASIFTGQYERRHRIGDFSTPLTAVQWAETYPALLRAAGYRTGFIGKFGVGDA